MKFKQYILERFHTTFKSRYGTGEIFFNPSSSEIETLNSEFFKDEENEFEGKHYPAVYKGLLDVAKDNIWLWQTSINKNTNLEHAEAIKKLGLVGKRIIPFYFEVVTAHREFSIGPASLNLTSFAKSKIYDVERLLANSSRLKKLGPFKFTNRE